MKTTIKYKVKIRARKNWLDYDTTISPIFFPLSCEWIDNNSCSVFANKITDFTITRKGKIVVKLFETWWIIRIKWHRYLRYQLPHKIKQKYLRQTYINNQLPF